MLTLEQKAARQHGVGASEAAIVMGLDKHISPYKLWLHKTGKQQLDDISEVPIVYWGSNLEEVIAKEYAKRNNCELVEHPETMFHVEHPFMLCHPDRLIVGQDKILECKFAMFAKDDWGPEGSDIVPLKYIIQVQHQLAVTGRKYADLAVLIGGYDYRQYHFERNERIIQKIIEEVSKFWAYVISDTAPEARDRPDIVHMWKKTNGNYKEADVSIVEVINRMRYIKTQRKNLAIELCKLEDTLTLFMKDYEGVRYGEEVICTWKPNVKGSRVLRIMETQL